VYDKLGLVGTLELMTISITVHIMLIACVENAVIIGRESISTGID
jgi:hypothetical protein